MTRGDETPLPEPGRNCWRVARADRFAFIVDAADYFIAARKAMLAARKSIFLVGWDFDAGITLDEQASEGPAKLGDFIIWLADRSPELEIRLLRWDTGALKAMFKARTLATIIRWKMHPRVTLKLDSAHPIAGSHHQKIVVIDDCVAFCGGIDMTTGRWDRRAHKDDEPRRRDPDGSRYTPWHDATSAFDGDAARTVGDLARERWLAATGERLQPADVSHDCWPDGVEPSFRDVTLAIARTCPDMDDSGGVHEIEQMYLDLIGRARRYIYAESQYFASRKIARAIAARLQEEDGPEIVIINPEAAEGWLEPIAMDSARARLVEALQRVDRHGRFRIYHPVTGGGEPIYVHAKVMIIDDRGFRVGSSNFNNRSLRLDTECDVILDVAQGGTATERETVAAIRDDLLAEHLGVARDRVGATLNETGSLIATIEALRGSGRSLVPYTLPELSGTETWLADNEILDPEGPDAMFEPLSRRGLFKGWRLPRRR
ncbi:phospholipase D-like domain-containing protein [Sphingomonas flavalba]|uniref:phospholipase D-like domain-containing protein n=1 Tax=Sphingomonas flavalba TaxID=2559804 RepID=UPI0019D1C69C|nr:phospholipase D-like domain-containing protein [Sphingomonas flavalba]